MKRSFVETVLLFNFIHYFVAGELLVSLHLHLKAGSQRCSHFVTFQHDDSAYKSWGAYRLGRIKLK
jgi:hypothetical protein